MCASQSLQCACAGQGTTIETLQRRMIVREILASDSIVVNTRSCLQAPERRASLTHALEQKISVEGGAYTETHEWSKDLVRPSTNYASSTAGTATRDKNILSADDRAFLLFAPRGHPIPNRILTRWERRQNVRSDRLFQWSDLRQSLPWTEPWMFVDSWRRYMISHTS